MDGDLDLAEYLLELLSELGDEEENDEEYEEVDMPARNRFNPAHPKWTEDEWKQVFHFRKPDMDRRGAALHLPDDMHTPDRRKKWSGMEGLWLCASSLLGWHIQTGCAF